MGSDKETIVPIWAHVNIFFAQSGNSSDIFSMDILGNIDKILSDRSLNKKYLAEKTGIPQRTIYNWWDRGSRPTVHDAYAIAQALGVTVEELMTGKAPEVPGVSARVREIAQDIDAVDSMGWPMLADMIHAAAERSRMQTASQWEESAEA